MRISIILNWFHNYLWYSLIIDVFKSTIKMQTSRLTNPLDIKLHTSQLLLNMKPLISRFRRNRNTLVICSSMYTNLLILYDTFQLNFDRF